MHVQRKELEAVSNSDFDFSKGSSRLQYMIIIWLNRLSSLQRVEGGNFKVCLIQMSSSKTILKYCRESGGWITPTYVNNFKIALKGEPPVISYRGHECVKLNLENFSGEISLQSFVGEIREVFSKVEVPFILLYNIWIYLQDANFADYPIGDIKTSARSEKQEQRVLPAPRYERNLFATLIPLLKAGAQL